MTNHETIDKNIYKIGGAAALAAVLVYLVDITISFSGGDSQPGTRTAVEWFTHIQDNSFLELRNLGFFNILSLLCGVPLVLALFTAHRQSNRSWAGLAAVFFLLFAAVYIANDPAIPMTALSGKYAAATSDGQRALLASAGEALLAQGEDFTPGSFVGFIGGEISNLILALVMLKGKIFSKANAWVGILGFAALIVFTIWQTFLPVAFEAAMLVAMVGGLLSLAWFVLTARKLFRL